MGPLSDIAAGCVQLLVFGVLVHTAAGVDLNLLEELPEVNLLEEFPEVKLLEEPPEVNELKLNPKANLSEKLPGVNIFEKLPVEVNEFEENSYEKPLIRYLREEKDARFWQATAQDAVRRRLKVQPIERQAKNVILFLGDGMSMPTLAAARVYVGQGRGQPGEEAQLSFEKFPYTGLAKTYCVNSQVADSACAATAYLSGVKTNRGMVGVSASAEDRNCKSLGNVSNHITSIMQWAQMAGLRASVPNPPLQLVVFHGKDAGRSTGLATTTRVTHASPSGAYAHADRGWESDADTPRPCRDIAAQLVLDRPGSDLKVIMGGGRKNFRHKSVIDEDGVKGARRDTYDLIAKWKEDKRGKSTNSRYVWNRSDLLHLDANATEYLLGLFASDHMQYNLEADREKEPSLPEMTRVAINVLRKNPKGYFLFVEGGMIDHAHHSTRPRKALDETAQLHEAVQAAVEMTDEQDTLIVVTADHSHTMSYSGYAVRGGDILGIAGVSKVDDLPYATLSYANGPGYRKPARDRSRPNLFFDDMSDVRYRFPATVPLKRETHGGDDVAVFARGPWAHLFTGLHEQHVIAHLMAFASCVGHGATACGAS